jgi:hypothetical protein
LAGFEVITEGHPSERQNVLQYAACSRTD